MPTTRGARKAQSEDTQSPLRSLEDVETKSRKKVSKAPKTLKTKVVDDKVTKRKSTVSKRSNKRSTKGAKSSDTEDSMDEDSIPQDPSEETHTELEAVQEASEEEEDESMDRHSQQGEVKNPDEADVSNHDVENGHTPNGTIATANAANNDTEDVADNANDSGVVSKKNMNNVTANKGDEEEHKSSVQKQNETAASLAAEPFLDIDLESQRRLMQMSGKTLAELHSWLKWNISLGYERIGWAAELPMPNRRVARNDEFFERYHETRSMPIKAARLLTYILENNPHVAPYIRLDDLQPGHLPRLPRATSSGQHTEPLAIAGQALSHPAVPIETQTKLGSEDVVMEGQSNNDLAQEDELNGRTWFGRSLARVASTMSWLSPRKPLREASGTVLNTPNGVRHTSTTAQSEPRPRRGRSRPLPGQSLGIHKIDSLSAERIRARHLQEDEIYRRKRELDLREEALIEKEEKMAQELSEQRAAKKRKRDDTTSPTPRGRSTYSMYDVSPSNEDDMTDVFCDNTSAQPAAQDPETPTRIVGGQMQTPASILRKSGAEPSSKRLRTGSRSVVWKEQLEEDSPLEKHSPSNKKQFVPRAPYKMGSLFDDTEQVLKSAQKPGVSRTIYEVRNKFNKTTVIRPQSTVSPAAKTFCVPEDSSSDEEELLPETPSKTPSRNIEAAGSTPHPVKHTVAPATEPPATPQPAHASLPSFSHTPAGSPPAGSGLFPEAGKSDPKTPLVGGEQQDQRLQKARESATPFTPKHPSRLRETETSAVTQRVERDDSAAPLSVASQMGAPVSKFPPGLQGLFEAAWGGLDADPEVLKDIEAITIPKSQLDALQPSLYEELLERKRKEHGFEGQVGLDIDSQYHMMVENRDSPLAKQRDAEFKALSEAVSLK